MLEGERVELLCVWVGCRNAWPVMPRKMAQVTEGCLFSGSYDASVHVWDEASLQCLKVSVWSCCV